MKLADFGLVRSLDEADAGNQNSNAGNALLMSVLNTHSEEVFSVWLVRTVSSDGGVLVRW